MRYTCYDDTVNEVEYVIHDNASGNIIIDKTVNTSGASSIRTFTLPAGLVHNRLLPYYLKIAVKNQSGKQSDLSDAVLFYCHEKPLLKFTDVDSTTVTTIPFPAFSFDVQYKNIEDQGETLSLYKYQLYDGDKNLLYEETHYTSVLKKGRYYVIQYGEHWLNQASDGAFTYNFNPTTGQYEKEPRDPQVRYYPKQVYNEETKHYETKYIKYDPATNKETELSDPALLVESRVYFIGQSQSHAMTKFVDAMPSAEQIAADKIAEACDNLEYVVVNDPNRTDDLYNSRLTIDKIGRRNLVCSGSEYEGYTSDESAMTVCKYTLWKNCRLTDSITLNMHMIPWLDVNEKVKYAPEYLKSDAEKSNIAVEWIIKKIDKNIGEGTMNVTLSRYYPYYPYITYENVLKEKYTDNTAT